MIAQAQAEMPVEFLVSHDKAASMNIDDHRYLLCMADGTVNIQHMGSVPILNIGHVPEFRDIILKSSRNRFSSAEGIELPALLIDR
jgi:hypothetical protein